MRFYDKLSGLFQRPVRLYTLQIQETDNRSLKQCRPHDGPACNFWGELLALVLERSDILIASGAPEEV